MAATCLKEIDAVILAGGLGTRLQSVLPDQPKVLAPVAGEPFLRHCLRWLAGFGTRRVILCLGHRADAVTDYVRANPWPGIEIVPAVEPQPLGTGGAVRHALPHLTSPTVLVLNGDSATKVDLCAFARFHRDNRAELSMVLTLRDAVGQSGLVETAPDGRVLRFSEKPAGRPGRGHINAGIYLLERAVIAAIPAGRDVSLEKEVFPARCGGPFYGFTGEFPFIDIGTPAAFDGATDFFLRDWP